MLWTLVAILLALWLVGWLAFEAAGGLIHVLLVVAAIVIVWQLVSGRRAV
ncbi:MAG TPA: lmo0937 family membrane protein [Gemmatimonadota bacterium]|nr:lmo0937 family membrane protein [Gemmatimonadota bacterium]